MALTDRDCRTCGTKLTTANARTYQGRWVGACRSERYHRKAED